MNEIEEIKAFSVGREIFKTYEEAAEYKYAILDDVQIGDLVSLRGGFKSLFGVMGLQGRVCRIEGDNIWFVQGRCPEELIMSGKLDFQFEPTKGYMYKGEKYVWELCCRRRKDLSRRTLPNVYKEDLAFLKEAVERGKSQ